MYSVYAEAQKAAKTTDDNPSASNAQGTRKDSKGTIRALFFQQTHPKQGRSGVERSKQGCTPLTKHPIDLHRRSASLE